MTLVHPSGGYGRCGQQTVRYRQGYGNCFAVFVVVVEHNVVFSDLENDFHRRTAGGLLVGKDIFIVGIAGCFKGIAILIGDDDLIDLISLRRSYGHGHGLTGSGIFGRDLHFAVFGRRGASGNGIFLGLFDHVNFAKSGNIKLDDELAVLIGTDNLAIQLDHFTGCGILIINNDFLFGICGIVCVDSDSDAVFNADIHRLAFNLDEDLVLNGRITVFGRRFFAGGVNGYVIQGRALLFENLLQLSDDLLHSLGRNIQLQVVAIAKVVVIIKTLRGILLQILNDGAQRNGDLGSTFTVNTTNIYGNIVVILILANGSVIIDGIVVTGRGCKDCLVGCVGINGNQDKPPVLEGIMEIDVGCLFGSIDHRDLAPSDQRFGIQHTVNHPGYREVNTLTDHGQGQSRVGHYGCIGEDHVVTVEGNACIGKSSLQEGLVNDRTVCDRKIHGLRHFLSGHGIGKQNVQCQRMLSYAVIICNGIGIVHHVCIGGYGDLLTVEEIDNVISFPGRYGIKNSRKLCAGSCKHTFYGITVLHVVEAVIADVDIQCNVNLFKDHLIEDVVHHVFHHQLVAADPEGIVTDHTVHQSSEIFFVKSGIESEPMVTLIQRADRIVIPICRDLIQNQSHQLLELNAVFESVRFTRNQAEEISKITFKDQRLQLSHGCIGVNHEEISVLQITVAGNQLIEGGVGGHRLVRLLQNELHLIVGQIQAEVLAILDVRDGNGILQPFGDLNNLRGIAVKRERNCPFGRLQAVGSEVYTVVAKGLIRHAIHGNGCHVGEAIHGIVFILNECLYTLYRYQAVHIALGNTIQHIHKIRDGIAVYRQDVMAVHAQTVYACVDTGSGNIVHHRLDFGLQRAIARKIHQGGQNLHIVGSVNIQRQHHSAVLFINLGVEHLIDVGNTVRNFGQLACQIGDRTRNDHGLVFACGSLKESTRIPTNEFAGNQTELRFGRIGINVHMTVAVFHGYTVHLPNDRVSVSLYTHAICRLCLDKSNQLLSRRNLFQCIQRSIDIGCFTVPQQHSREDHVVRLAVFGQKNFQLGHIFVRKMLRVICIFFIQIIFDKCCQRITVQFKIFMSFKETLQISEHFRCHFVCAGRQNGTYHDECQQNCRQQCRPKLLHAAFVFVHITPPVIHIFHCYTLER